jgi:HEAT repeat protein
MLRAASQAMSGQRAVVLGLRVPGAAQRLVLLAVHRIARRWPNLARLLGIAAEPTPGSARPDGAPAPGSISRPDAASTTALIAALRDPRAEVAVEAAEELQRHPPERAVSALCDVLHNRDGYFSSSTRAAAVRALGVLLPMGNGDTFAAAAADLDASVSLAAIAALVDRNEGTSVDVLLRVLEDPRGFYVPLTRHAAARGLALIGPRDPRRVSALLENESDSIVREALISLVGA